MHSKLGPFSCLPVARKKKHMKIWKSVCFTLERAVVANSIFSRWKSSTSIGFLWTYLHWRARILPDFAKASRCLLMVVHHRLPFSKIRCFIVLYLKSNLEARKSRFHKNIIRRVRMAPRSLLHQVPFFFLTKCSDIFAIKSPRSASRIKRRSQDDLSLINGSC